MVCYVIFCSGQLHYSSNLIGHMLGFAYKEKINAEMRPIRV